MSETNCQPPAAWRYCGSQIKLWRAEASVSRAALADEAGYDCEYVKSMENGRRRPTLRLLQVADQMCGAGGKLAAAQQYLKPEPFPQRTQAYVQAEAEAIALYAYGALLIPGLLQTKEYAYELLSKSCPPVDEDTVRERVAGRLKRQQKLHGKPPAHVSFVIHEAALRGMVGGRDVMRSQLAHLLEVGKRRNVSIQVLPFAVAPPVALGGPMVLVETVEHEQYGYVEGQETGALYADADTLNALRQRLGAIRMQALNIAESARFIGKVADEL
ncbi:helix-turn-helix domain-containing protein [Streptomyces silvensis]|uniref:DNA-binding protein n=1 Tax=Streptomyces silvensis TaxID=1765722 RepID=A0A0W7X531_9ACTN|nr:helix-turn-helix transcriptional regulator [Streptomyces silvensis]KUF17912.1 DNA-binding protein [Streptomyces silvensis]